MSATEVFQQEAGEQCEVLFVAVTDDDVEGQVDVTVIATRRTEDADTDEREQVSDDEWDPLEEIGSPFGDDHATAESVSPTNGSE